MAHRRPENGTCTLLLMTAAAAVACGLLPLAGATAPPTGEEFACSTLPPGATPVLNMSASGVWIYNCDCSSSSSPDTTVYCLEFFQPGSGGSYANLTGGGYSGQAWWTDLDHKMWLWPSNGTVNDTRVVLTMPLALGVALNGSGVAETADSPSIPPSELYVVSGTTSGTAGSWQAGLQLPPIRLVVRTAYSEAAHTRLPDACNPKDPAQHQRRIPFNATYLFYTC
ncbi:hypothetical protein ABPG75_010713 [Micractinium tetrahymenae]